MNPEDKKFASISAHMEGLEVQIRGLGKKVKISEMEMILLVNMAEVGVLSIFSGIEGKVGEDAEAALEKHLDSIRATFEGLPKVTQGAVSLLRGKLSQYLVSERSK